MTWKSVVHSATGVSHIRNGIECQDYGSYINFDNIIIGAVCDGAGSARFSRKGAEITVESTLCYLKDFLNWQKRNHKPIGFSSVEQAQSSFKDLLEKKVIKDLESEARSSNHSINDYACTLLVVVASPKWIASMQIGDGFIVFRPEDQDSYQLLFLPDRGQYMNETTFITCSNAIQKMKVDFKKAKLGFICASTDGLENVALNLSDWTPGQKFFEPFEQYLSDTEDPEKDVSILDFLNSEDVILVPMMTKPFSYASKKKNLRSPFLVSLGKNPSGKILILSLCLIVFANF